MGHPSAREAAEGAQGADYDHTGVHSNRPKAVMLNVYDVTTTDADASSMMVRINDVTHYMGLGGVFHGGIAVDSREWSFGYCPVGSGVYSCQPAQVTSALHGLHVGCMWPCVTGYGLHGGRTWAACDRTWTPCGPHAGHVGRR